MRDSSAAADTSLAYRCRMSRVSEFRRLHDDFLLLPNAWDAASAAALAAAGFAAVGTTSLGVASAAGLPDGAGVARAANLALAARLTGLAVPVSVDIEGGYSDDPAEVRALGAELAAMGVAGVNLEDGHADGTLADPAHQAELIAALKENDLFVNARTDAHWLGVASVDPDSTLDRCRAYVAAGADGVFVPGMAAEDEIRALVAAVPAPVNLLFAPGRQSVRELAALGARRVSTGSLLFRVALGAALETAVAVRDAAPVSSGAPGYDEVQNLVVAGCD
jgi:2-methylisocitrate lyase-like PEP mutase family enzyme